jgi:hypothetical protein
MKNRQGMIGDRALPRIGTQPGIDEICKPLPFGLADHSRPHRSQPVECQAQPVRLNLGPARTPQLSINPDQLSILSSQDIIQMAVLVMEPGRVDRDHAGSDAVQNGLASGPIVTTIQKGAHGLMRRQSAHEKQ